MSDTLNGRVFLDGWSAEFVRAIEMFSGSKATVAWADVSGPVSDLIGKDCLWWKQSYGGDTSFVTWIGSSEPTWSALGNTVADDPEGAKQIFLEMLGQAQEGAATLLSNRSGKKLKCQTGQLEQKVGPTSSPIFQIRINLAGSDLSPIVYIIEPSVPGVVNPFAALEERAETENQIEGHREQSYGVMVDQFLDLELPLSVVLGRSLLPIRDVLKLTSGSIVELDSKVGDLVDVVVQGKVVARGEVVSIKGNYGVRITEIAVRRDRLVLPRALEAA